MLTELTMTTAPAPTAIPNNLQSEDSNDQGKRLPPGTPARKIPKPKLRLHVEDLRHPSSSSFLALIPDVASTLETALENIIRYLYTPPKHAGSAAGTNAKGIKPNFDPSIPPTRSVTVFLRDFEGVAYTTGSDLDDDHKEIHLSLPYITHCTAGQNSKAKALHELVGVLTHELVHCYQHTTPPSSDDQDAGGRDIPNPPGGLIEGIADFVRLKAGLEPPHWKRPTSASERASKWDAGYQSTAFFLAWIEDERVGEGAIGMLNDRLFRVGYVGEDEEEDNKKRDGGGVGFWESLFGTGVAELWDEYGEYLDGSEGYKQRHRGNWEEEIVNP